MRTYSFYVGSTDTHDAHRNHASVVPAFGEAYRTQGVAFTRGVRNGATENVAIYTVELASDVQAQRLAFALAVLTGNDAVLTVRDVDRDDHTRVFGSTAAYRVDIKRDSAGNRTLYVTDQGAHPFAGYRYTPTAGGAYVAYLVGLDNTVTPVA